MNGKRILITGGAGFLGSHLAAHYLAQGTPVTIVDNLSTGSKENIRVLQGLAHRADLSFVEGDVCNGDIWQALAGDFSYVFHLASPASPRHYQARPIETIMANSTGLQMALNFSAARRSRLVFASTSEVYGDPQVCPQPENYFGNVNTWGPRACYDESKRLGETIVHAHNQQKKTRHGVVRIFNTYGPRMQTDDGRVIIEMLIRALRGQPLTIFGSGQQTRSFCFVTDLIDGLVQYANSDLQEPMNLGSSEAISILDLSKMIAALFPDQKLTPQFLPGLENDPQKRCPDLTRAHSLLRWRAQIGLREGLVQMLDWLRAQPI